MIRFWNTTAVLAFAKTIDGPCTVVKTAEENLELVYRLRPGKEPIYVGPIYQ